jgi:DNA primase
MSLIQNAECYQTHLVINISFKPLVLLKKILPWIITFNPRQSFCHVNTIRSNRAKRIAEVMEQKWPDRYTSNVRKVNRKNKIFIDWIRNGRGATSIAPYSIRARSGARVSMPITWEELDTLAPDGITMADALTRIKGDDPWKDYFTISQRLR